MITDGQHSIRNAVRSALPDVPYQLCHFHYLREAAKPIADADRHAKKEMKKYVRGVRPIERALEGRTDEESETMVYLAKRAGRASANTAEPVSLSS